MKKRIVSLSLLISFITLSAPVSAANLNQQWKKLHRDYRINVEPHSYCLKSDSGGITGQNVHKKVTIASVAKLITSLFAIEKLGSDYQYETKFYFNGKKLHIAGSLDPVFSKRKLFFLLSQFNNLGINELEEISFDKKVMVFTKAEGYTGEVIRVSSARTAANLKDFWHTPSWNKLKTAYKEFIQQTPSHIIKELQIERNLENLSMKVGKVTSKEMSTIDLEGYSHLSPALEVYLKYTNLVSNNYIADKVFDKLGGEKAFDDYFETIADEVNPDHRQTREGYKSNERTVKMFTGSGLNTAREGRRVDNFANCSTVVGLIKRLDDILERSGSVIQKVVAVPGRDGGTFRRRLRSERFKETMVAKTGTLYHTSALAGMINAKSGRSYFGIFHQMTGAKGNAKTVQNKMVEKLWESLGEIEKLPYDKKSFFPAYTPLKPL
jgi:D-alanyl-D-alanine carboxypeptidase/D-alanyl-D-alanine-endopeptidase (penicillin-binding protein 4)